MLDHLHTQRGIDTACGEGHVVDIANHIESNPARVLVTSINGDIALRVEDTPIVTAASADIEQERINW